MDIDQTLDRTEDAEMELDQPSHVLNENFEMEVESANVDVAMQQDTQEYLPAFSTATPTSPLVSSATFATSTFVPVSFPASEPTADAHEEHEMTPVEKEDPLSVTAEPLEHSRNTQAVETVSEVVKPSVEVPTAVEETPQAVEVPTQPSSEETPLEQVKIPLPLPTEVEETPAGTPDLTETVQEAPEEEAQVFTEQQDEADELDPTREGTPILDDFGETDGSFSRPTPQLDYLSNVTMPAIPDSSASDTSSDTAVKAPPIKLSYINETFWLFGEDLEEHETPVASTSGHHETGILPVLLKEAEDHRLYYTALETVFAKLHEQFPSFAEEESEMVLRMDEDFGIDISEDNTYARELSLYDLDRIHVGCNRQGRLHLTLESRVRAIHRFNTLAAHVAQYTGLLPLDESDLIEPAEEDSLSDNDELEDLRDENDLDDAETEATILDETPQDFDEKEALIPGENDELDEQEGTAPEQYEDAVDESGLEEAQQDPPNEDESPHEAETDRIAAANGNHETNNVDELQQEDETTAVEQPTETTEDVPAPASKQEDDVAQAILNKRVVSKSPKRSREEDAFTDLVNTPDAEAIPDSKRVRAA